MEVKNYDALIIGFGKGGKTLGAALAKAGKTLALVEKDPDMYGGTCINVGCIPSKSLYTAAAKVNPNAPWHQKQLQFNEAVAAKNKLTSMLRQKNYHKLNSLDNVTIYNGTAVFTGEKEVKVETPYGSVPIKGDKVFINTGSTPWLPPIEGIATTPGVYTGEGIMNLTELPKELVILGGGYIGLEFASIFAAFGSKVTVVQNDDKFLPREDEDIAAAIKDILTAQGIKFSFNTNTLAFHPGAKGPVITLEREGEKQILCPDAVLVSTGRVPNTGNLNCEAAGVQLSERGAVEVDQFLRTTAPNVWAMGDVNGGPQHTYISLDDFRLVFSQLSKTMARSTGERGVVPMSLFLATPYARVGMNQTEAENAGYEVRVFTLPTAAVPKAQVLNSTEGVLKAVVNKADSRLLGVMLLCPEAHEVINIAKLAIDFGSPYQVLRDQIYTHPTMAELFNDLFQA